MKNNNYLSGFRSGLNNPKGHTDEVNADFRKGFAEGQSEFYFRNSKKEFPNLDFKLTL